MITSIFDIDGTLANGYMITDFPQYLLKRGMFNGDIATEMENTLKALKSGIISYREAGLRVPGIYAAGIRGQEIKEVRDLAEDYLKGYMKNVFPFTRELVKLMNGNGETIAMSGSPAEVVEPFCREYGLGSFLCTEMGTKNGSFDGNVTRNMIISENKERMFEELVSSRGIRLEKAFGFGDTKQDMPFLSRVGYPVPLNPDDELKEEAVKRGWPFFDYHDDVVGEVRKIIKEAGS